MSKPASVQVDYLEDGLELDAKPLTHEEAILLRPKIVGISAWGVLGVQAVAGLLLVLLVWGLTKQVAWSVSAGYGVLAVVLPAMFFARGLIRGRKASTASQALAGVFFWEAVKIVLTLVMLVLAPKVVLNLNWLALLAGFVVTMKASWLAMFWLHKRKASLAVY